MDAVEKFCVRLHRCRLIPPPHTADSFAKVRNDVAFQTASYACSQMRDLVAKSGETFSIGVIV